jgi:hypothetical protein
MLPGYERSWNGYHVLALGVERWIDDLDPAAWAHRVRQAGGLVAFAHPGRYHYRIPKGLLAVCDAVEVWNSKGTYDGSIGPDPRAYRLLGAERLPLCGQDLHGARHLSRVAIELPDGVRDRRAIFDAIRRGDYRMTNGRVGYGRELTPMARRSLRAFHLARRPVMDLVVHLQVRRHRADARRRHGHEEKRPP